MCHTILLCAAMPIVSFLSALALIFRLLLVVSGSAPGDEHGYCVNTVNVDDPPSAREPGRNILLDTYNYAALLTRVTNFTNPVLNTFPPVFQRFDVDGSSSPTLVSLLPPPTQFSMKYVHHRVTTLVRLAASCAFHCRNGANSEVRITAVF